MRCVVGVDGSGQSERALQWAIEDVSARGGGEVVAVMTWNYPIIATSPMVGFPVPAPDDMTAATKEGLDQALSGVEIPEGVTLTPLVVEGTASQTLIDLSKDADLLVVGSRGHGEFTGMLLGSVSLHCVTHAKCPVVVVR